MQMNEAAERHGVSLIAPDRPEFGHSDPKPDRTILDWVDDAVSLLDANGHPAFHRGGISVGGAHAAACAWSLPKRVTALVCHGEPYYK
jgi:pimeloyl-ACP methyl ester carboxylesterase